MAEIKIEKKKTIWPWVLIGLLILAVILYFLFFRKDNDDNIAGAANTTIVADSANNMHTNENNTVDAYITYLNSDTATMGLDHVFTHNALIKLIDAIKATADKQGFNIQGDLDKAKEDAEKITGDPMATTHADFIKDATTKISMALQNMQEAKYPQLSAESQKVKNASNDINTAELTLDQKHTVKTFFNDAGDLLKKMN